MTAKVKSESTGMVLLKVQRRKINLLKVISKNHLKSKSPKKSHFQLYSFF